MLRKLILIFALPLFTFSCGERKKEEEKEYKGDLSNPSNIRNPKNYFNDCKKLFAEAQSIDSTLYTTLELDRELGNRAIKAFSDYAYYCSSDSLSPIFLIKTAQVAKAINNLDQAKLALENCIAKYPDFNGVPAAYFLLGQLYDDQNYMNNEAEAKRLYEELIAKFPKSPEAESARGALKYIGKTDEQMMEDIKRNQKKSNVMIQ
jgi:TolA-binding protein